MNAAAANALLKTLEEPPAGTYLILVSRSAGTLAGDCAEPLPRRLAAPLSRAWKRRGRGSLEQGAREPDALLAQAGGAPLTAHALDVPGYQSERATWLDRARGAGYAGAGHAGGAHRRGAARACAASASRPPSIGCRRGAPTSRPPAAGDAPRRNADHARGDRHARASGGARCPSFVIIGRLSRRGRRLRIR